MRPQTIDEFVGQRHFLGPGKLLRRMLDAGRLGSLIFYGPPGCGKTALARIVAGHTRGRFATVNAVASGTKELREILDAAARAVEEGEPPTVLFVDEIHRFNKAQQDVLLPDIESGLVVLIGATTQNPFFALNAPLLSRSALFAFEPLAEDDVVLLLRRAVDDADRGLGSLGLAVDDDAIRFLARTSDGDARRALTALEVAAKSLPEGDRRLSLDVARDSVQRKVMNFDPTGDTHYDLASALIKSMRGSDPDAAVYWLARMLESGEDPRFIARRIVICASEDVGNADPQALGVATAMLQAVEFVGLPECGLALAQAAVYIACAPKSNAVTMALADARAEIRDGRTLAVPKHLRDAHYPGAAQLGHGTDYQYSHDFPGGWVDQAYLPESRLYYVPTDRGFEAVIRERLDELRKRRSGRKPYGDPDGSDRS
jgi:putative ATPase